MRGEPGRYTPADLVLLEGLVSQASIALESARLVDLHDDGRRSWQEVVDAISPALCIVDRGGRIRRANLAFADLVNAPPASLIGRPWQAFAPPEWATDLQRVLDQQGAGREVDLRTGERTYAVTVVPISSTDRSTVVLLFDDQTERRRLQDQLIQSEKMSAIGQLIAGIAHDLNNPLASVVGFADYLTEVPNVPPSLREPLTVIQEEAERASNIVKNLLSFARKQEHQRRPTALKPLLDATFLLLRNNLMAYRVEASLEIEPDLPMPDIDPNQIQQVFVNLINNAAQAIASTGRPGTVVVRARRWLDGVAVDVADNGPGMSETLAAQVFEPFFTTKPEGEGTGLGLVHQSGHRARARRPDHALQRGGAGLRFHGAASARDPASRRHPRTPTHGCPPNGCGCWWWTTSPTSSTTCVPRWRRGDTFPSWPAMAPRPSRWRPTSRSTW